MIKFLLVATSVVAHSWIDCLTPADIDYQGPDTLGGDSLISKCIGFPRGYPGRENPDINIIYTTLIHRKGGYNDDQKRSQPVCGDKTQVNLNYTQNYPMSRVKAGTQLKLWYTANGHANRFSEAELFSYGKPNRQITNYLEFNDANRLIQTPFATPGNCRNVKEDNTLCWNDWTVPSNWTPGTYSVVWFWPWDDNKAGEDYTTCFEVEVVQNDKDVSKPHSQPGDYIPVSPQSIPVSTPVSVPVPSQQGSTPPKRPCNKKVPNFDLPIRNVVPTTEKYQPHYNAPTPSPQSIPRPTSPILGATVPSYPAPAPAQPSSHRGFYHQLQQSNPQGRLRLPRSTPRSYRPSSTMNFLSTRQIN